MKKTSRKINLKKTTVIVLNGTEKKQMQGGYFTITCGPFTFSEPWRCVNPSIGEC
jgi:hypothetical protein